MKEKLVIGYYGNGKSTNRYHIPHLMRRGDKIEVKTIYARRLRDSWARWDGVYYTDKEEELLGDDELDVIIVTTPPEAHYEIAKKVIESGHNVVLEKPFTHSVAQSQELFDLAGEGSNASVLSEPALRQRLSDCSESYRVRKAGRARRGRNAL